MSVATHLGIDIAEYDARIRTFIPFYEEMLEVAASLIPANARSIVELGIGTGALAQLCRLRAPKARVTGIDSDAAMLQAAARRLGENAALVCSSFLRAPIPHCDVAVASFALHHIRTQKAKGSFYRRLHKSLRGGGRLVNVDCQPAASGAIAARQFQEWDMHLRQSYSARQAVAYLNAWSKEDVYVPLDRELELLRRAGFAPEVVWRKGAFAVIHAI